MTAFLGEEIPKTRFDEADYQRFHACLARETRLLRQWADEGTLLESGIGFGCEVEAWLIDHNCYPNPCNEHLLERIAHPYVVPELSRFNVELNCTPQRLTEDALSRTEQELTDLWRHCDSIAHGLDAGMLMVGILPTVLESDLTLANMSTMKRYYALNNAVLRQRGGRPLTIDINGIEHLSTRHADVMLEAATTSFQVHLQVPAGMAHRYFNASLLLSGPVLAAAVNSPFLFGHDLWAETRIPLFEQAIAIGDVFGSENRVDFGHDYLGRHLVDLFDENETRFPILLPLLFDEPAEQLRHLRLHNGTIWRWVRPLVGFAQGQPHLRTEFRILPAGPTMIDMMANAALYAGATQALVRGDRNAAELMPHAAARANFHAAAIAGLDTELGWLDGRRLPAAQLILDELVPMADEGLAMLGVTRTDRRRYMDVVRNRVLSGQTGSQWLREYRRQHRVDMYELTAAYRERQRTGLPVHEWPIH